MLPPFFIYISQYRPQQVRISISLATNLTTSTDIYRYSYAIMGVPIVISALWQSVRSSKSLFNIFYRIPSHHMGLSVTLLIFICSLHCLIFIVDFSTCIFVCQLICLHYLYINLFILLDINRSTLFVHQSVYITCTLSVCTICTSSLSFPVLIDSSMPPLKAKFFQNFFFT